MKESIGSVWIFAICMTFIVLFTGYIAISVNYSKAFRIKSYIVSEIEENLGWNGLEEEIRTYLTAQGYNAAGECPSTIEATDDENRDVPNNWTIKSRVSLDNRIDGKANACIYELKVETDNDDICAEKYYYKVLTFFKFDLPVVNVLLTFKVSGDTDYIMDLTNTTNCG